MFKSSGAKKWKAASGTKRRMDRDERTKSATVSLDGYDLQRSCTIRDINAGGARISLASTAGLPAKILLICRAENLFAIAQVRWARGNEIGLQFVERGREEHKDRLCAMQQAYYREFTSASAPSMATPAAPQKSAADIAAAHQSKIIESHCRLLGIEVTQASSEDALREAFKRQAKILHPDQGGSAEQFQALVMAYQELVAVASGQQLNLAS